MKFHIFRLNLSDRSRTRVGKEKEDEGELQWRKKALDEKFYIGTKKEDDHQQRYLFHVISLHLGILGEDCQQSRDPFT